MRSIYELHKEQWTRKDTRGQLGPSIENHRLYYPWQYHLYKLETTKITTSSRPQDLAPVVSVNLTPSMNEVGEKFRV